MESNENGSITNILDLEKHGKVPYQSLNFKIYFAFKNNLQTPVAKGEKNPTPTFIKDGLNRYINFNAYQIQFNWLSKNRTTRQLEVPMKQCQIHDFGDENDKYA